MRQKRKHRLYFVIALVLAATLSVIFIIYALGQNINLYLTPKQVKQEHVVPGREFRLGGIVENGSVHHAQKSLRVNFQLTDGHQQIEVFYKGILPSLFRVGQGIVAEGHLNKQGMFIADQVLAKHDAKYMPPEIHSKINKTVTT